jgi:PilZ domain
MARTERRLAERFGIKIPLRVRIAKSAAPEHTAESLNISTRGICFATDLPLCQGTPVHLAFEMPEQITHKPASEWRCTGHVVHVEPNSSLQGATCVGVRFDCYEVRPAANQISQLNESTIRRDATAHAKNVLI